jgi:hypothetical protein
MKWIKIEDATPEQLEEELLGLNANNNDILLGYYIIEPRRKIPMIEMDSVSLLNPTHIIPRSELIKLED